VDDKLVEGGNPKDDSHNSEVEAEEPDKSKVRITTRRVVAAPPEAVDINTMLSNVPPDALGLFIVNSGDLVLIEKAQRVTLGRQMEDAGPSIAIDLTSYGGAQAGVSRRHAVILVYQDMHLLQDLGSTNGTWLNAVCLPQNGSHVLRSGDMIQLGQIRIQAVFHGSKT